MSHQSSNGTGKDTEWQEVMALNHDVRDMFVEAREMAPLGIASMDGRLLLVHWDDLPADREGREVAMFATGQKMFTELVAMGADHRVPATLALFADEFVLNVPNTPANRERARRLGHGGTIRDDPARREALVGAVHLQSKRVRMVMNLYTRTEAGAIVFEDPFEVAGTKGSELVHSLDALVTGVAVRRLEAFPPGG